MQKSSKLPHIAHWSHQRAAERQAQAERRAQRQRQRLEQAKEVKALTVGQSALCIVARQLCETDSEVFVQPLFGAHFRLQTLTRKN